MSDIPPLFVSKSFKDLCVSLQGLSLSGFLVSVPKTANTVKMGLTDKFKSVTGAREVNENDAIATGADAPTGNAHAELRNFRKQHRWDPFLDIDKLDNIDDALASGNAEKEAAIDESLIQEDSPYPEVRASVPPVDEDMPVDTIRAWTIGALMCTIVAACNILLSLRRAPISISSTVVQLIAYP